MVVYVEEVPNASPLRTQLGTQDGKNPLKPPKHTNYPPAMNSWEQFQSLQGKSYLKVNQTVTGEESPCGRVSICPSVCQFSHSGAPSSSLTAPELQRSRLLKAPHGVFDHWMYYRAMLLLVGLHFVCSRTHRHPWDNTGDTMHNPAAGFMLCCFEWHLAAVETKQFSIYRIRKFIFANL